MQRLLVIVGPTGSGKTELAIQVAERFGAEIVSADSQQVYRGMNIGTGKASAAQRALVPHHLLDIVDPNAEMSAADFVERADTAIEEITARARPLVVVGGTMLYVKALLRGLFEGPPADPALRTMLTEQATSRGLDSLWQDLNQVDEESASRIHATDQRRLIRALEVQRLTGVALSEHHRRHQALPARYQAKLVGLQPERQLLYDRIDARVNQMIKAGLVEEVCSLRAAGYGPNLRSQQAIGYGEMHSFLNGDRELSEAISLIQRNSRRYARRQLSWYRGDNSVQWSDRVSAVDLVDMGRYLEDPNYD